MTIRTSFLLDVIFVFRRSCSVRSLGWMDLMSVDFSSQFMYWPDAHFLYLVNFNYYPLSGHSDRGACPLSGVSVNYELPHGTVQEFTVYEPVSAAWSHRCVRSPTNLSTWRLHCWTAAVLNANIWLSICSADTSWTQAPKIATLFAACVPIDA